MYVLPSKESLVVTMRCKFHLHPSNPFTPFTHFFKKLIEFKWDLNEQATTVRVEGDWIRRGGPVWLSPEGMRWSRKKTDLTDGGDEHRRSPLFCHLEFERIRSRVISNYRVGWIGILRVCLRNIVMTKTQDEKQCPLPAFGWQQCSAWTSVVVVATILS